MFGEIRREEKITEQDRRLLDRFRNIKPEKELTMEELNRLVELTFSQAAREAEV